MGCQNFRCWANMQSWFVRNVIWTRITKIQTGNARPAIKKMITMKAVLVMAVSSATIRMPGRYGCLIIINRPVLFLMVRMKIWPVMIAIRKAVTLACVSVKPVKAVTEMTTCTEANLGGSVNAVMRLHRFVMVSNINYMMARM